MHTTIATCMQFVNPAWIAAMPLTVALGNVRHRKAAELPLIEGVVQAAAYAKQPATVR